MYGTFVAEIPVNDPVAMEEFQKMMDSIADESYKEIDNIAATLGVSDSFASAIFYLRTRARWTKELENELVQMSKTNQECPNMSDWPSLPK